VLSRACYRAWLVLWRFRFADFLLGWSDDLKKLGL